MPVRPSVQGIVPTRHVGGRGGRVRLYRGRSGQVPASFKASLVIVASADDSLAWRDQEHLRLREADTDAQHLAARTGQAAGRVGRRASRGVACTHREDGTSRQQPHNQPTGLRWDICNAAILLKYLYLTPCRWGLCSSSAAHRTSSSSSLATCHLLASSCPSWRRRRASSRFCPPPPLRHVPAPPAAFCSASSSSMSSIIVCLLRRSAPAFPPARCSSALCSWLLREGSLVRGGWSGRWPTRSRTPPRRLRGCPACDVRWCASGRTRWLPGTPISPR